jgi:hypothetical protein
MYLSISKEMEGETKTTAAITSDFLAQVFKTDTPKQVNILQP